MPLSKDQFHELYEGVMKGVEGVVNDRMRVMQADIQHMVMKEVDDLKLDTLRGELHKLVWDTLHVYVEVKGV